MSSGEDQLEAAVRHMWTVAAGLRNVDGEEVRPIGFFIKGKELGFLPLDLVPYEAWRDALCALAAAESDIVGVVTEAWCVKVRAEDAAAYEAARALGVRNKDRDDRIEILQVLAEDYTGRTFCLRSEIKNGRVGAPEPLKDYEEVGGRLTGLFPPVEGAVS